MTWAAFQKFCQVGLAVSCAGFAISAYRTDDAARDLRRESAKLAAMAASLPAQRAPLPGCASPELQSAARQALQRDLPGAQLREFEPVPKYTSDIMVACTARLTAPARDQRTALTLRRGGADQWAIAFDL